MDTTRVKDRKELFPQLEASLRQVRARYQDRFPDIEFKAAFVAIEKLTPEQIRKYTEKRDREQKKSQDGKKPKQKLEPPKTKVKIEPQPPTPKAKVDVKHTKDRHKKTSSSSKTEKGKSITTAGAFEDALFQPDKSLLKTSTLNNFKIPKKAKKEPSTGSATATPTPTSTSSNHQPPEKELDFDLMNEPQVDLIQDILGSMTYPPVVKKSQQTAPVAPNLPRSPPRSISDPIGLLSQEDEKYDVVNMGIEDDLTTEPVLDFNDEETGMDLGSDSGSSQEIGCAAAFEASNPHDELDYGSDSDDDDEDDDTPYRRRGARSNSKRTSTTTISAKVSLASKSRLPASTTKVKSNPPLQRVTPQEPAVPQVPTPKYQFSYDHSSIDLETKRKQEEEAKRKNEEAKKKAEQERIADKEAKRRVEKSLNPSPKHIGQIKIGSKQVKIMKKLTFQGKVSPRDPRLNKNSQPSIVDHEPKESGSKVDQIAESNRCIASSATTAESSEILKAATPPILSIDSCDVNTQDTQTDSQSDSLTQSQVEELVNVNIEIQQNVPAIASQAEACSQGPELILDDSRDEFSPPSPPPNELATYSNCNDSPSSNTTKDAVDVDFDNANNNGATLSNGISDGADVFSHTISDKHFADLTIIKAPICYTSKYSEVISIPLEPETMVELPEDPRVWTDFDLAHEACPPPVYFDESTVPLSQFSLPSSSLTCGKRNLEDDEDAQSKKFKSSRAASEPSEPSLLQFLQEQGHVQGSLNINEICQKRSLRTRGTKSVICFSE